MLVSIECSASLWSVSAFLALWQCLLFVLHVLAFALFERYSIRHSKGIVCIVFVYPTLYICRLSMSFTLGHLYGSSILHDPEKYSSAMYLLIFTCEMLAYYVNIHILVRKRSLLAKSEQKQWHFEWPNQNSKTTFIVQTFPKYGPYGFDLVNLSLLGPILAKFQFC